MKVFDEKHIKNIVLLGCSKSGKTTLAETMLYEAGLINRRGKVEEHNTVSDYHEIEQQRECSVYATPLHTEWHNYKINIIDTPGLDDFIGEVNSSVRVADTCVFVVNAQQGVEIGTELIWNNVDQFSKPTLFAIMHAPATFAAEAQFESCSATATLRSRSLSGAALNGGSNVALFRPAVVTTTTSDVSSTPPRKL